MSREPFIQKLTLRNFRSIRNETVTFANPMFLVGRNGSGKSNFVDALAFLADCMTSPLQSVIEQRGGLGRVGYLETSQEVPYLSLHVEFRSQGEPIIEGFYAFSLRVNAVRENGQITELKYEVAKEQCVLTSDAGRPIWFDRVEDRVTTSVPGVQVAIARQSLAITLLGGVTAFSSLYQSLTTMRVYKIGPDRVSGVQNQDDGSILKSDGSNINSVLQRLSKQEGRMSRVRELLQSVVPGIVPSPPTFSNGKSVLFFEQQWPTIKSVFEASAMSTGTLYALGLTVAALQEPAPSLIAIEEPELNIHPGALEAIADIINTAAERTQVVITTHSPDLLDTKWIQPENLRVVEWENGATHISELGEAPIKALRQHLMGAGELLRANALDAAMPSPSVSEDFSDLFEKTLA